MDPRLQTVGEQNALFTDPFEEQAIGSSLSKLLSCLLLHSDRQFKR